MAKKIELTTYPKLSAKSTLDRCKKNLCKASLLQAKQALNIPHIRSHDDQHIDNAEPRLLHDNHYAFISHCQGIRDAQEDRAGIFV